MTNPIVQPITDEQLERLEDAAPHMAEACSLPGHMMASLIARLRAAENDQARYLWLKENAVDAGMWTDESIDAAMRQG